jgi:5'-deoxynucleotidase YfbR-like HD superfamily hydrolase
MYQHRQPLPEIGQPPSLALSHAAKEIAELWHEYEAGTTPEALFVKGMVALCSAVVCPVAWL